ncbi:bifunctional 5,10-methylenetetrahydrofolate dehydrogenase/5,10-methenyltetrahydrofolate cyclohydrolase [Thermohalobacter berrensis]|uniref:Bifunctional protein FolD n=1 Tax=Thermohalobacter berrensis TaxID=99594 RepID=A0A419TB73_9FIRM|nr:bifunctional 5,10-methylenetetrahydrofolate dehydrogenase/5,10-methenyltetrahydrofolate cyclohydrolase [Thermohalobacter berrensis]RKD34713.1 bifunctional 5,10-methylene-tetrahydrofolate dehydrogenase/5,10-methylene-tetrahydrofolate cyclohydrolase [Thermohalobacter berrensis]
MTTILKGKPVADKLNKKIKKEAESLKLKGINPTIGIVQVGNRADDVSYRKAIINRCEKVGVESYLYQVEKDISMSGFIEKIKEINNNPKVHGILIFRPLPKHLDYNVIKHIINPNKDIDCMHPYNLAKVFEGELEGFVPCTPKAVMEILKYYEIPLIGANAVIVNSSVVVGKPLSMMLLAKKATVTICNSKTKNLTAKTKNGDIVITAIGKAKYFGDEYFSQKNNVIDVGINTDNDGKICGDVNYDLVKDKVKAITPVPGGVGSVTTSVLLDNVIYACKKILAEKF